MWFKLLLCIVRRNRWLAMSEDWIWGWFFNDIFDCETWATFYNDGESAMEVFGWRWFEDRDNDTEGWVEFLPSGYFKGLNYWDKDSLVPQPRRWFWVHSDNMWVKAAFQRWPDGSVCRHLVPGTVAFADYRLQSNGFCTLYWDDDDQQRGTKCLWISVGGDDFIEIPDDTRVDENGDLCLDDSVRLLDKKWIDFYWNLSAIGKCSQDLPWRLVLWFCRSHLTPDHDFDVVCGLLRRRRTHRRSEPCLL